MKQSQPLVFQDVTFDVIDRNGEPWLRGAQIALSFGYTVGGRINTIYEQHKDEFTTQMTALVQVQTPGGPQQVRIFSLRGAHLLGMFARTPRAVEFRKWVLNVLEGWRDQVRVAPALPEPVITKDAELAIKQRAKVLADSFYPLYCLQMRHAIRSGALAGEHVPSWLPTGMTQLPPMAEEPGTTLLCHYDHAGQMTIRKMMPGEYIWNEKEFMALHDQLKAGVDAVKAFMARKDATWIKICHDSRGADGTIFNKSRTAA